MFTKFWAGFSAPFEAVRLILRNRKLLLLSAVPILFAFLIHTLLWSFIQTNTVFILELGIAKIGLAKYAFLHSVASLLGTLLSLIFAILTFSGVVNLVSVPFNDLLAETAEKFVNPSLSSPPKSTVPIKVRRWIQDALKSILASAVIFLAVFISWIPVIGIVGWISGILALAYTYLTFPETRRDIGLRFSMIHLAQHLPAYFGLGLVLSILLSIPLISFLFFPVAVVSGTLLFARLQATNALRR